MTALAPHVSAFFQEGLTLERRASVNTCLCEASAKLNMLRLECSKCGRAVLTVNSVSFALAAAATTFKHL